MRDRDTSDAFKIKSRKRGHVSSYLEFHWGFSSRKRIHFSHQSQNNCICCANWSDTGHGTFAWERFLKLSRYILRENCTCFFWRISDQILLAVSPQFGQESLRAKFIWIHRLRIFFIECGNALVRFHFSSEIFFSEIFNTSFILKKMCCLDQDKQFKY